MKGVFISFEGGEGSGKTTLIKALETHFRSCGNSVVCTREPGGTVLGEAVRSLLLHSKGNLSPYAELSLFLASRAQQLHEVIRPALLDGKIVLCDRFNDSTIAYQGVARGLGIEKVSSLCTVICEGMQPHLSFYLDLPPEIGLQRAEKIRTADRIEAESLTFHKAIRNAYLLLQKNNPQRIRLLDAAQSPHEVYLEALKQIEQVL